MTWFTENPWPLVVLLGIGGGILLAAWSSSRRKVWLAASLSAVGAAVAVYFVERAIVTDRERVEQNVLDLTAAFQRHDRDKTLSFFSLQAPEWRNIVELALERVAVKDDLSVKDMSVRLSNENTRAVSHFRANGTVSYEGNSLGHQPSRWELTWQKEAGDWKIVEVKRLNTIKDEKLEIFEQRPH